MDFEAAEKKAKEEAQRIEKLGYDPDAEEAATQAARKASVSESTNIVSPTPISPAIAGGFGAAKGAHQRSASEVERLGMGMGRLGFGQVGASKTAQAKKAPLGFGSVGPVKATEEGKYSCLPQHPQSFSFPFSVISLRALSDGLYPMPSLVHLHVTSIS